MPRQGHCGSEVKEGSDEEIYNSSARIEYVHHGIHLSTPTSLRNWESWGVFSPSHRLIHTFWNPSVDTVPVHVSPLEGEK